MVAVRLKLVFHDGLCPLRAEFDLLHGVLVVRVGSDEDDVHAHALIIRQHPDHECIWVEWHEALRRKSRSNSFHPSTPCGTTPWARSTTHPPDRPPANTASSLRKAKKAFSGT